ncbi:MAG: hypothetical protein LUC43_01675, partial [Burkholderiales bacterium]|nr:hypothetical protein [Burkholderiales bacterium]
MSSSSRYGAAASRTAWQQYKKVLLFLIILGAVVFTGLYFFSHDQQPRERAEKTTTIDLTPSTSDHERYKALYEERLIALERQVKDANEREQVLKKELGHMKEKLDQKVREPSHPLNSTRDGHSNEQGWPDPNAIHVENNVNQPEIIGKGAPNKGFSAGNSKNNAKNQQAQNANPSQRAPRLVLTDVSNVRSTGPAESILIGKTKEANKSGTALTYLTSGTFAKARLLNGATAPTRGQGSGNPVPVLLELTDAAIMPNLYRSGIQRCFVTANATGELASERVLIRLERLSC